MLSAKIKALRKMNFLSQASFGKRLNVTQGAVSQWETGITKPNYDQLNLISDTFGVTIDWLLEPDEQPQPQTTEVAHGLPPSEQLLTHPEVYYSKSEIMYRAMRRMTEEQQTQAISLCKSIFPACFLDNPGAESCRENENND